MVLRDCLLQGWEAGGGWEREREAGASLWKTLFGICGEDQAKTLWLENKEVRLL